MAAQEIELIGQQILLRWKGFGVQVVDEVFPQLPPDRLGSRCTCAGRRGNAVDGAGLNQQRAGTRETNLIGRLNATSSAVRAHTSLRQLGPVSGV